MIESMGDIYQDVNVKIFGPFNVTDFSSKENTKVTQFETRPYTFMKDERELKIRGRNKIIKKVKDIHQNFSEALTAGCGSGKIADESFDRFLTIEGKICKQKKTSLQSLKW